MDKVEAQKILTEQMERFKKESFPGLVNMIGEVWAEQIKGDSQNEYNVEIEVFWDNKPDGDVRVLVFIDVVITKFYILEHFVIWTALIAYCRHIFTLRFYNITLTKRIFKKNWKCYSPEIRSRESEPENLQIV